MYDNFKEFLTVIGGLASIAGVVVVIVQAYKAWKWSRSLTWDDSLRAGENILKMIETGDWKPVLVVGIGRSGGIWGGWLAGNLGSLPFEVVDCKINEITGGGRQYTFPSGKKLVDVISERMVDLGFKPNSSAHKGHILLIEGAVSTGGIFNAFINEFGGSLQGYDIKTATLFINPAAAYRVSYVGRELEPWPDKFPWHLRQTYQPFLRYMIPR